MCAHVKYDCALGALGWQVILLPTLLASLLGKQQADMVCSCVLLHAVDIDWPAAAVKLHTWWSGMA